MIYVIDWSLIKFTWNIRLSILYKTYISNKMKWRWRVSQNDEGLRKLSAPPKWIASRCNQEARYNDVISVSRGEREGGKKGRERKRRGPRNEFSSLRRSLVSDARRRNPALVVTLLRVGKVAAGSTIRASPRNWCRHPSDLARETA